MRYLVGSKYFFNSYPDFVPHDTDYIDLLDTNEFKFKRVIRGMGNDIIQLKLKPKDEIIAQALNEKLALVVGKFLVPEFNAGIGFTIEDLPKLQPLIDRLDKKHLYEKIIYEAYLENNSFTLTDAQRDAAYAEYKKYRVGE